MTPPTDQELMTTEGQRQVYEKRAKHYDLSTKLYYLLGLNLERYRRFTIDALQVQPGASVLELGCGTGGNFPYVQDAIGPDGHLTGIDLTPEMLDQARARVDREGWDNVTFEQSDMATFDAKGPFDGALSTFAYMLSPDQHAVCQRVHDRLRPGARFVILDFREPDWPEWLIKLYEPTLRPYGALRAMADRRPWEGMEQVFGNCWVKEYYHGAVFLAVATKR